MSLILVAKTNALIVYEGRRIVVKGKITTAHEDHPIVRAHPDLWEPQKIDFSTASSEPVSAPVETATAAPGERRSVSSARTTRRGPRTKGDDDK
jgi:hypothetical protein